jgi:hypothetical protein
VSHYHWLLCAGFRAHTDWTEFLTLLDSRSKDSAELLILLPNPKYSFVGSVKNRAVPFQHDALPDERSSFARRSMQLLFSQPAPRSTSNSVRNVGTLMSLYFQESVRTVDVFAFASIRTCCYER